MPYTVHARNGEILASFTCPLYGPLDANRFMRTRPGAEYWCSPDGTTCGRKLPVATFQPHGWTS